MNTTSYLAQIKAKLAEDREFLEGLQSGKLHYGNPFDGRTQAKIYDLNRKIAENQAILDKQHA